LASEAVNRAITSTGEASAQGTHDLAKAVRQLRVIVSAAVHDDRRADALVAEQDTREYTLKSIRRVCCAECDASGAQRPPEFTPINSYPLTENDLAATQQVAAAFDQQFGKNASLAARPASANEDFSVFGRTWGVP
jgi:hypothetical protein